MLNLSTNLDVVWKKPGYLSSAFGLGQVAWFFQTTSRLVDRFMPNLNLILQIFKFNEEQQRWDVENLSQSELPDTEVVMRN